MAAAVAAAEPMLATSEDLPGHSMGGGALTVGLWGHMVAKISVDSVTTDKMKEKLEESCGIIFLYTVYKCLFYLICQSTF